MKNLVSAKKNFPCLLIIYCVLMSTSAFAAAVCSVASTGTAFGNYDTLSGSNKDVVGIISVTCTGSIGDAVSYTIGLSPGNGSFAARDMQAGGAQLRYNLYSDASRLMVWGDGTGGTSIVSDNYSLPAATSTRTYTVYGEIPIQTGPIAGSYLDTLVITLNY
jgi:spore coat protein U-like protein